MPEMPHEALERQIRTRLAELRRFAPDSLEALQVRRILGGLADQGDYRIRITRPELTGSLRAAVAEARRASRITQAPAAPAAPSANRRGGRGRRARRERKRERRARRAPREEPRGAEPPQVPTGTFERRLPPRGSNETLVALAGAALGATLLVTVIVVYGSRKRRSPPQIQ